MTNDEPAGIALDEGRSVLRPSLMAIGLIVTGIAVWMLNDQQEKEMSRPPVAISQNG